MIEIKNLTKIYNKGQKNQVLALDNISYSFPSNGLFCLLGQSGCGKSTLLNILGGLDSSYDGKVEVDGIDLSKLNEVELNNYRNQFIGFVFQDNYLIQQLNVIDNITLGMQLNSLSKKENEEKALNILKKLDVEDLAYKKVNELSGGQAQRIAIARALLNDQKILLADEPTGALDSKNSQIIMDLLKEISINKLVILVTHNEELAKKYASQIINMKDGKIIDTEEDLTNHNSHSNLKKVKNLRFSFKLSLSLKNFLNKKTKSILTAISNSFGLIGLGFFLALNTGFKEYSTDLSYKAASSLPVVISSYTTKLNNANFSDYNASIEYPSTEEIYPSVNVNNQYSYKLNNFTSEYFTFLNSLKDKGDISSYTINYGNSYSFNLMSEFPASLNSETQSNISLVNTSISTTFNYYSSISNLPSNIFHVLYGNVSDYDVIAGNLPKNDNELVLVTDKYNAVSFNVLKNLGFYNQNDVEDQVKDPTLASKVKPISFKDVLNKEYKIFTNDEAYSYKESNSFPSKEENDIYNIEQKIFTSNLNENLYKSDDVGYKLKIVGIIRPKSTSTYNSLSPSLCYLPSLNERFINQNKNSNITNAIKDSLVLKHSSTSDAKTKIDEFFNKLQSLFPNFSQINVNNLPIDDINKLLDEYFYVSTNTDKGYYFTSLANARNNAIRLGADLISDELINLDNSSDFEIRNYLFKIYNLLKSNSASNVLKGYNMIFSLSSYLNAYSSIQNIILFPKDLKTRSNLLIELDNYNTSKSEKDKIEFRTLNDTLILEDVGNVISLASLILLIFACICLVVSCSMTFIFTMNNVLERNKEIALYRTLGIKKFDIISIFEYESLLLGLLSGIVSSIATFILTFPINNLIYSYYKSYNATNIAHFKFYHAIILIGISLLVSFISSLIPSYKASKIDPIKSFKK